MFTFVAPPDAAVEAAFQAIALAAARIDLTRHQGEHPRMGATDVVPFVPVRDVTMDDCVALARTLAARVGDQLQIPVFLYARAAARPERERLPDVRKGQFEGLRDRIGTARTQGDQLVASITFDRRTTFSELLAEMDEAAVEAGIEIRERLYDQQPIEGADHYGMLTITSNYRGQYDKLVKFLNRLDRSERFLIIESLGATPRAESNDLQFTLKIDTFVRDL